MLRSDVVDTVQLTIDLGAARSSLLDGLVAIEDRQAPNRLLDHEQQKVLCSDFEGVVGRCGGSGCGVVVHVVVVIVVGEDYLCDGIVVVVYGCFGDCAFHIHYQMKKREMKRMLLLLLLLLMVMVMMKKSYHHYYNYYCCHHHYR